MFFFVLLKGKRTKTFCLNEASPRSAETQEIQAKEWIETISILYFKEITFKLLFHPNGLSAAFTGFPCVSAFTPCLARRSDQPSRCFVVRFYCSNSMTYCTNTETVIREWYFAELLFGNTSTSKYALTIFPVD